MNSYSVIFRNGLWHENPGLAQLLGLCPLLAVSNTVVNGIGLGLATLIVVCATNLVVSATRDFISAEVRLPVFVLIIASLVTVIELSCKALFYDLYLSLGLFIPLITTNCLILGRAESFASRHRVLPSLVDGLGHGIGFALTLILLGAAREIIGFGTLFRGAEQLMGSSLPATAMTITFHESGILLMLLPPGAFIALGLLVALRNQLTHRQSLTTIPVGAEQTIDT